MKDIIYAIIFLSFCIVFGILFYTNEQLFKITKNLEKRIIACENSILMGTKTDEIQFRILNEMINRIDQNRKNSIVSYDNLAKDQVYNLGSDVNKRY